MSKQDDDFEFEVKPRHREMDSFILRVPKETLSSLERVAKSRDMSIQALVQLYIGQGLRQDLARLFSERLLDTAAEVLARHIESKDEVNAILREIQGATTADG
jgi:hypothetical protein